MAKKLRVQDRLLLGLTLTGDILANTIGGASHARKSGTLNFISPPGYKNKNLYATVWRMLKTGNMEKVTKAGKPYLRLTNKGKKKLVRDFPLLKWQDKRWDGKWRLVIFDIEEKNRKGRDALRWKLVDLGFGQLQKSTYISPHDIGEDMKEFLESKNYLSDEVLILEAEQKLIGDPKELANKVWQLPKLEERYLTLEMEINKLAETGPEEREEKIRKLYDEYVNILLADPFLPGELLPPGWPAEEIQQKLLKLASRS